MESNKDYKYAEVLNCFLSNAIENLNGRVSLFSFRYLLDEYRDFLRLRKLCPRSGPAALRQLNPIHKKERNFSFFYNVCIDAIRVSTGDLDFNTAQKVSVFGAFLVRIFPHSDWIRGDAEYLSVFSPNVGKYRPENILIGTLFTQCKFSCFCVNHVFWCFFPLIWFWYMTILQRSI